MTPGNARTCYLAIDVGATKIATAVVDDAARVLASARVPTPRDPDPEAVFAALVAAVGDLGAAPGEAILCGVGCGGPMRPGGTAVSPLNIPSWRDFPLQERVAALTGLETVVDNDAKAFALGEGWCGAARGEDNYVAFVVSSGVGAGVVLDGRLLEGAEGNAGHLGHVIVEPDGRYCACGARGCLEAHVSGLSIEQATGAPAALATTEVKERAGMLVGRALASVANLLDLRLAVAGGSVALGFGEPFLAAARHEIDRRARLAFSSGLRLELSPLGTAGGVLGAAALARARSGTLA